MQTIGFVGVGRMGANMAHRLKDCGFPISAVYDTNPETAQSVAAALDTIACTALAEITQRSEIVFTVVPDDAAMAAIYGTPDDNLLIKAQGKLFINCATITPQAHIQWMARAAEAGARMLEAPMASSIPQARNGELFLMVAGDTTAYQDAQPLWDALSSAVVYTGQPGSAASLKALVNMVMNINTAALAEGLGLAESLGLDLATVKDVFAKTGANSRVLQTDADDMIHRDHDTYFSAAHAAKDSAIAVSLGRAQGLAMVLASATQAQYDQMVALGLGELDKSGISELTFKSRLKIPVNTPAGSTP